MSGSAPGAGERVAARLILLRSLARLEAVCREIIDRPHYVIRDGEVATGDDGEPMPDPGPARQAQALLREIGRDRERLTGRAGPAE